MAGWFASNATMMWGRNCALNGQRWEIKKLKHQSDLEGAYFEYQ